VVRALEAGQSPDLSAACRLSYVQHARCPPVLVVVRGRRRGNLSVCTPVLACLSSVCPSPMRGVVDDCRLRDPPRRCARCSLRSPAVSTAGAPRCFVAAAAAAATGLQVRMILTLDSSCPWYKSPVWSREPQI